MQFTWLYFISFEIFEPILVILKNKTKRIPLKPVLAVGGRCVCVWGAGAGGGGVSWGVCSLANYSVAYEDSIKPSLKTKSGY